jgi:hypothetical protein
MCWGRVTIRMVIIYNPKRDILEHKKRLPSIVWPGQQVVSRNFTGKPRCMATLESIFHLYNQVRDLLLGWHPTLSQNGYH